MACSIRASSLSDELLSKVEELILTIMRNRRKLIGVHPCKLDLGNDSDSGLPKCDPSAGKFTKLIRQVRKIFLASFHNSYTHIYIKSHNSLLAERKRHVRSRNWFVIHPLSIFAVYREMVMTFVWISFVLVEPFMFAFSPKFVPIWGIIQLFPVFDIMISFIHGYIDPNTMEIVLDIKLIVKRYISTCFIVDLVSSVSLPVCMCVTGTFGGIQIDAAAKCAKFGFAQAVLRFIRMFTAFKYLHRAADFFDINRQHFSVFLISLTTFVFAHFAACLIVGTSLFLSTVKGARSTFIHLANIDKDKRLTTRYICGLAQACTLFFRCSLLYPVIHTEEKILQLCITLSGQFYFAYVIVQVYEIVNVSRAVGNKYERVYDDLQTYMLQLKLPKVVCKRILLYYEYRFEKQYFRESAILDTLSEHLRYEIMLFTCMPLVKKAIFFQKFSKHLIGQIIAALNRNVYLCNDVVFKTGDKPDSMFFIYCGTVAAYSEEGYEYLHFEDGDNFGEGQVITGGVRKYSAVAAEITEIYTLKYNALKKFLRPYPQFMSQIRNSSAKRCAEATAIIERMKKASNRPTIMVEDTLNFL